MERGEEHEVKCRRGISLGQRTLGYVGKEGRRGRVGRRGGVVVGGEVNHFAETKGRGGGMIPLTSLIHCRWNGTEGEGEGGGGERGKGRVSGMRQR